MLNYYQPWLLPFLRFSAPRQDSGHPYYYFHSFEDGLWALLKKKFPGKKLHFLIPDFYCSDVLDNLKNRGHKYTYYQLDKNFQISASAFRRYLWLFRPDVVIIFHACGITSSLLADISWLSDLPDTAIIVEDSVHRLVDPGALKFLNSRHYILDSLRKVSPFPGSRMFASEIIDFGPGGVTNLGYFLSSGLLFLFFRFILWFGITFNIFILVRFAHEQVLMRHDEIIGDALVSHPGVPFLKPVFRHIDYNRVSDQKIRQVKQYVHEFRKVFHMPDFYRVEIPISDYGFMHVYPLGFNSAPMDSLVRYLHSRRIPVWFKFTDSPWSQKRGVLFLPLGFHISSKSISGLADTISNFHP